jgi:hypothetical protein
MTKKFHGLSFLVFVFSGIIFFSCASTSDRSNLQLENSAALEKLGAQHAPIPMMFNYRQLRIQDVDQIMALLYERVAEFKQTDDIVKLQEGVQIAYSRPDEDRLIDKVISVVKVPLEDEEQWPATLEALVHQNLERMKDESLKSSEQITAGIVLENLVAEIRPAFVKQYTTGGLETRLMEKIAVASVQYSRAAESERKLILMRSTASPNALARRLLENKQKALNK